MKRKLTGSIDEIMAVMTTAEYAEEESIVTGAVRAKARIQKNEGGNLVIVVEREDPSRVSGSKDFRKTEKVTLLINWTVPAKKHKWNVKVKGFEKLIDVHGETWFESAGESDTMMYENGVIDVKLPLIGNLIAAGIVEDIKKDFPVKSKLIEKKTADKK